MREIRNSKELQAWLLESGHLAEFAGDPRFLFDEDDFGQELEGVWAQYPRFSRAEAEARAALRLLGKEEARTRAERRGRPGTVLPGPQQEGCGGDLRTRAFGERLLVLALILLATLVALLAVPRAHGQQLPSLSRASYGGQDYRSLWLVPEQGPGQPNGVIWQWQQGGGALHTFAGGVGVVNCSTNIACNYSSNPPTITITGTGGSGSGCIPPGTTGNALLFDSGSGACSDISKLTWNSASGTVSLLSGGVFDPTAGTMKVPGASGQLLYNNGGNLGAEDPVVSGPDARGAAQTKNPVAGLGGIDYGTGCSGGPCVQEAKVDSSGNQFVQLTGTLPGFAATPSVQATNFPVAVDTNTGNAGANTPRVVIASNQPSLAISGDTNGCDGSTGSAVPAKGCYHAGNGSGNLTGYLNCDSTAVYDASANGATQLVALSSGKRIYVCGFQISTSQTSAVHVALEYGTGSNCATSPAKITPSYPLQAAGSTGPIGMVVMTPGFTGLATAASNELCILTDAAASVQALVWYTQF